jgi:hypothetical protein
MRRGIPSGTHRHRFAEEDDVERFRRHAGEPVGESPRWTETCADEELNEHRITLFVRGPHFTLETG